MPVKVEYYDDQHHARLNVSWEHVSGSDAILTDELYEPTITAWRGEYYNNRVAAGTPNLVRDDEAINFDWGLESPALSTNGTPRLTKVTRPNSTTQPTSLKSRL